MNCVTGFAKLLNEPILLSACTANVNISHDVYIIKDDVLLSLADTAVHPGVTARCQKQEIPLHISQVCSINIGNYIKVDKETLWVTKDVWEQLMITSNCEWVIE